MKKYEELSEEEREKFFNSKLFQKYYSYRSLSEGIETIKNDDVMYRQLVNGILGRVSQLSSSKSVKQVLDALVKEIEEHTELVDDSMDEDDLDSVFVDR